MSAEERILRGRGQRLLDGLLELERSQHLGRVHYRDDGKVLRCLGLELHFVSELGEFEGLSREIAGRTQFLLLVLQLDRFSSL